LQAGEQRPAQGPAMDAYQEFLLTVRRDINCLSDSDRNTRRNAIGRLDRALAAGGKAPQHFVQRLFLEELHKPLFRLFADQTEKCREVSMAMTFRLVDLISVIELENMLPLLLAALLGRYRAHPFPEPSEELRVEGLRFLKRLFEICQGRLNPFASEILDAVAKALADTCPDAKKECCELTKKVSAHFDGERISRAGGPLVAALLANLRHQQWKVRRATLDSLGSLLSLEAPMMDHMEDALPVLGEMLRDRTAAVRQCLSECLERWLVRGLEFKTPSLAAFEDDGGPAGFDKFEHRLLILLLSIVADEDVEQVATVALGGLERVAVKKHEARQRHAQAERKRWEARKQAQAATVSAEPVVADEADAGPSLEVSIGPDFNYAAVQRLLPEPFASGRPPAPLTATFVQLHLPTILPQVLTNLTQWQAETRVGNARLLRIILVLANRQVSPLLDHVLVHLYKASADDEPSVAAAALQCAGMAGAFLEAELILGLMAKHLGLKLDGGSGSMRGQGVEELWPQTRVGRSLTRTVQDVTAGVKSFVALSIENRRQVFTVLAHLLHPDGPGTALVTNGSAIPSRLQPGEVRTLLRFFEEGAQSDELLPCVHGAMRSLLRAGGPVCCGEWPRIFDLLLRMRSGSECGAALVDATMDSLAALCGRPRRELYEEHLHSKLSELLLNADNDLWEEHSAKRHVLETLLRNAGGASAVHLAQVMPALARQASPDDASAPVRVDILGLVHFLITQDEPAVAEALHHQAPLLLTGVLIPNCTWKAGQSNSKIRKGGLVCIHALLQRHLVCAADLNASFASLLPVLKSCLDDSWMPDNRLIACMVLGCTLSELQAEISGEQLREVYPELLKRLDDSNDQIRAAVCEALTVFFKCLPPKWSRSLYEYILRTLFVHLDDPNPDIQQGIYRVLEAAVHQDYDAFLLEAQAAGAKSSHPRLCEELARLAETLRQAS